MVHELTPSRSELPPIDDWRTRDSRRLTFVVSTDEQGTPKDVSDDALRWALLSKPYDDRADAILDDTDAGVTIRTDPFTDPTQGEFEVKIDEDTVTEWGDVFQRVVVDPSGESRQSWVGPVTVTARGGGGTL
jgi:hypothetical protein